MEAAEKEKVDTDAVKAADDKKGRLIFISSDWKIHPVFRMDFFMHFSNWDQQQ